MSLACGWSILRGDEIPEQRKADSQWLEPKREWNSTRLQYDDAASKPYAIRKGMVDPVSHIGSFSEEGRMSDFG